MAKPASSVPCSDWPVATRTTLLTADAAPAKAPVKSPVKSARPARGKVKASAPRRVETQAPVLASGSVRASIHTPESRRALPVEVARNVAEDSARRGLKAVQLARVHQVATSVIYKIFSDVRAGRLEVHADVRDFHMSRAHSARFERAHGGKSRKPAEILADLRSFARSDAMTISEFVAARKAKGVDTPSKSAMNRSLEAVRADSVEGLSKQDREKILAKIGKDGIRAIPRRGAGKSKVKAKVADTPKPAKVKPAKSVKSAPKAPAAGVATAGMFALTVAPDGTRRAELPGTADPEMLKTVLAWLG